MQRHDSDSMTTKCSSGQSFFFVDNSGFGQNYTNELRKIAGNENATFQVLPIPENSLGERRAVSYDTRFGKLYAINANAKNKDQIFKFIDWMYSMEASDITNYGIEGETFQYNADGEAEYISDYVMQFKDAHLLTIMHAGQILVQVSWTSQCMHVTSRPSVRSR